MIISPKLRSFICTTAHPQGCEAHVLEQINFIKNKPSVQAGPKKALIIGASTGYGLASRIALAFGCKTDTLGVFFERNAEKGRTASPGWYNTAAFEAAAASENLYAGHINGDAFSEAILEKTIKVIRRDLGQVDCVIYSLASPRRADPISGKIYKSVLKSIGKPATLKTLNTDKAAVHEVQLESASPEEIKDTVKVMGGEDWERWMRVLKVTDCLSPQARTIAYSYIGPELTYPIYHEGTIGAAKRDLITKAQELSKDCVEARVSVNKAVVTQASSAIPSVPLYLSVLMKVMREQHCHEDCIEQMHRLFSEKWEQGKAPICDAEGQIRLDDFELSESIQGPVSKAWRSINTENLHELADFKAYQKNFLKLFGFGLEGLDENKETEAEIPLKYLKNAD